VELAASPTAKRVKPVVSATLRRIGIVALARTLLIALWRYLETDHLPDGALLKT
jgi:hypothetical protein